MTTKHPRKSTEIKEARVVSKSALHAVRRRTKTVHIGGIKYLEVLGCIPNMPGKLADVFSAISQSASAPKNKRVQASQSETSSASLTRYFKHEMSFYERSTAELQKLAMTPDEREAFRLMTGYGQHRDDPRASRGTTHPITRAALGIVLHETMLDWGQRNEKPCYGLTLACEAWHTSLSKPVMNLYDIQAQVSSALNEAGYEGLFFIDLCAASYQRKDLHLSVSGIIMPTSKKAKSLNDLKVHLTHSAPTIESIDVVRIEQLNHPEDVAGFMLEAAKSPDKIKRATKSAPFCNQVRKGKTGYTQAFDLLRVRSLLGMHSIFFATEEPFNVLKKQILRLTLTTGKEWGVQLERCRDAANKKTWRSVLKRAGKPT